MEMEIFFPGEKRVDARYKGFTIRTDQSEKSGGGGSSPAPFDFFLASIGTCVGIYILDFCQKREIPSEDIRIIQRTERDGESKMIARIELEIRLPRHFPEKYRKSVVRAAELCAVKKHMQNPPEFDIFTMSQ